MKLPWIRSPTLVGLGTETPTSKPSMARPRRMLLDASITKPMSAGPVGDIAAVDDDADLCVVAGEGGDRIRDRRDVGRAAGDAPDRGRGDATVGLIPPVRAVGRGQVRNRLLS